MSLADEASRIGVDGVADLAEVLSPRQRAELLELLHRFHGGEHPPLG
jgi:predicted transcriptional regulator